MSAAVTVTLSREVAEEVRGLLEEHLEPFRGYSCDGAWDEARGEGEPYGETAIMVRRQRLALAAFEGALDAPRPGPVPSNVVRLADRRRPR